MATGADVDLAPRVGWRPTVRRVGGAMLSLAVVLGPLALMRTCQELELLEQATIYQRATFVVSRSRCTGGESFAPSTSSTSPSSSTDRRRCLLQGTIGGAAEEMLVGENSLSQHPPGSRIPAWYAPQLEPFGVDGQNLRLLMDHGPHPTHEARAALRLWPTFFATLLAGACIAELAYRSSGRFPPGAGLVVAGSAAAPMLGFAMLALGGAISLGGMRSADATSMVVGAVPLAIGLPFCFRPLAIVHRGADDVRLQRGFGPLVIPTGRIDRKGIRCVVVSGPSRDETLDSLGVLVDGRFRLLLRSDDRRRLIADARRIAATLEVGIEERIVGEETAPDEEL
ncbi:MAG: hypothetical protein DWQ36_01875 [Acidobacteria bacterium]|nr:MAG: hypothetical protein DWQ36_01875 [Acidobacteriota bacterium]